MTSPISVELVEKCGAVTFLDVIGWKGIWQRKTGPISDLQNLIRKIEKNAEEFSRGLGSGLGLETKIASISDTIVIFTQCSEKSIQEGLDLHGRLCSIALPNSVLAGIPLRGATGYGNYNHSDTENIYVGKAIDEAASWHEVADWIGVFMTPSAAFKFDLENSKFWKEFAPPLKINKGWRTPCVDWRGQWMKDGKDQNTLKNSFSEMGPITPEISGKFTNTLDFIYPRDLPAT